MRGDQPVWAVALVDASPVLLLPSALALMHSAIPQPARVDLIAHHQLRHAANRLAEVLRAKGVEVRLPSAADAPKTLEQQLAEAWSAAMPQAPSQRRVLDLSASTGGTAARSIAALEQAGVSDYDIGWFCEDTGSVRFLSPTMRTCTDLEIDIGSGALGSAVTPAEFLSVLGLGERREEPYGDVSVQDLLAPAQQLLATYAADPRWNGPYGQFRKLLRPPGVKTKSRPAHREVQVESVPSTMQGVMAALSQIEGWIDTAGSTVRLAGPDDSAAVFFLSGGWLEVVVAEAIRRGLPDRQVHMNLGTTWGYKARAEAETDVTFVYDNCLYLLSCKNEAVHERLFSHLDRFRALVAEFGESRTRPVLLSTSHLERPHLERCATFEIGVIHGTALLRCLQDTLSNHPHALFDQVVRVSQVSPRAGLA